MKEMDLDCRKKYFKIEKKYSFTLENHTICSKQSHSYVQYFAHLNMYLKIKLKAVDATVNSLHLSECS